MGGPRDGPPCPPTFAAPRLSRGAALFIRAGHPFYAGLHLVAEGEGDQLQESHPRAALAPRLVGHIGRMLKVLVERPLESLRDRGAVEDRVELVVEGERAVVQVGAPRR